MKKKVLFLANHFITLFSFRKELIRRLVDEGHEVYLSLPKSSENAYFENMGCTIIETSIDRRGVNPIKDINLVFSYKRMISKINPDIIFSYTIKPNIYGAFVANKKYKQVCNITGTGGTFLKKNLVGEICKILYRLSVKKAYKVYFQNTGDRDYFIENKMIGNNYDMLPGSGCDLKEHVYTEIEDSEVTRFMFIGRVMKLKGIEEFLCAAKRIKSEYNNSEFIIAGWNEEEKYKKLISEYQQQGIVNYIGFRKDISEWIKRVECVVLPSHGGEGVPNVLLESAATGRVCIGSRINGTMDVIDDGVTGYLFNTGDAADLADKMEQFIKISLSEKIEMGKAGRNKIEKQFDRELVIAKYMEVVNGVQKCVEQ